MQIGFIGENLHTWSPFKLWDPENATTDEKNEWSSKWKCYPINRTYSCYIKIKFLNKTPYEKIILFITIFCASLSFHSCADFLDVDKYFYDMLSVDSAFSKQYM